MNIFDQEIMARTALGEARGEGDQAMQAVMWTGLNRFTSKKWYSEPTIAGTFLKYEQYDCWMGKDPNYGVISNLRPGIMLYDQAMVWAASILNGNLPDPTQGATHYYADGIDAPSWSQDPAIQTVRIGRQTFFANVA